MDPYYGSDGLGQRGVVVVVVAVAVVVLVLLLLLVVVITVAVVVVVVVAVVVVAVAVVVLVGVASTDLPTEPMHRSHATEPRQFDFQTFSHGFSSYDMLCCTPAVPRSQCSEAGTLLHPVLGSRPGKSCFCQVFQGNLNPRP